MQCPDYFCGLRICCSLEAMNSGESSLEVLVSVLSCRSVTAIFASDYDGLHWSSRHSQNSRVPEIRALNLVLGVLQGSSRL